MKKYILLIVALNTLLIYSQITLPINFEDGVVTTDDFIDLTEELVVLSIILMLMN